MHSFRKFITSSLFVTASFAASAPFLMGANNGHKIKHVFVIVLENEGYNNTFGPTSKAPYLSQTLVSQGALLTQYYGTGHASLDNYIAMISGQPATNETRADCQTYADFTRSGSGLSTDGLATGSGCIYPASIKTLPDQLNVVGKTWRAYMEDMGNDPARESVTCGHPKLNTVDMTQSAEAPTSSLPSGDQYATRHNPFAYFHSIIDSPDCNKNVVNLNQLTTDLGSYDTTPNFVFITPNLCNDGHDAPCVTGQPGGLVSVNNWLQTWVPAIMNSEAYLRDGLLIINFDESDLAVTVSSGGAVTINAAGTFCCNQQPGPNLGPFPQSSMIGPYTLNYQSYGGDRTGAVLLSPFIKAGTVSNTPFNHYSLLKTLEEIFDTNGYLGYANAPSLVGFFGCVTSDLTTDTDQFSKCK
jgi:hypothetical protein